MPTPLPQTGVPPEQRATATWAAALLLALARDEAAGRRPPRLTEPGLPTWKRFKGRLTTADLLALLFEDAAAVEGFRMPFDPATLGQKLRLDRLPAPVVDTWLRELGSMDLAALSPDYIADQARLLGLPTRLARSDLQLVRPHQKVLELPGTGGQLAHWLASTQEGVTLQDNVTVACGSWQELTLAGVVALDLGAPSTAFALPVAPADLLDREHPLRQRRFDFVVGLHPDKGGLFRAEDQLHLWFSDARILLV